MPSAEEKHLVSLAVRESRSVKGSENIEDFDLAGWGARYEVEDR